VLTFDGSAPEPNGVVLPRPFSYLEDKERVIEVMRGLGWTSKVVKIDKRPVRGFERPQPPPIRRPSRRRPRPMILRSRSPRPNRAPPTILLSHRLVPARLRRRGRAMPA